MFSKIPTQPARPKPAPVAAAGAKEFNFNTPIESQGAHLTDAMSIEVPCDDNDDMSVDFMAGVVDTGSSASQSGTIDSPTATDETDVVVTNDTSNNGTKYLDDVLLEYMGVAYWGDCAVLRRESDYFKKALDGCHSTTEEPTYLVVPTFQECESSETFYAALETMFSGTWIREEAWELKMSYLSCVKIWLMGHHWGINAMKTIAMNNTFVLTKCIMDKTKRYSTNQERRETETAHLASFIRAIKLANRHEWHAKLWKELYDCGSDLAPKLRQLPEFKRWAEREKAGADFARAIGIKIKPREISSPNKRRKALRQ